MNPQFCSALPMRPKLVPFVVRPTAPVGYGVFDPPSPQYNINFPVVPVHLSHDPTLSTATSKTRRDLEQLGSSSEKWSNMIFELAAQKNGIRIGTVSSKGGMVKQGNSLEDFKKIAERNGITVCQEGSQKAGSVIIESDVRPVCITAPHQDLSTSLSSMANGDKNSCGEEPVDKQQNVSEPQGSAALFEAEVEEEMNESKLTITDVYKDNAAKSGIIVQDISDSLSNQTEQCGSLSGEFEMVTKGDKCGLSGEDMVCEPKTVPAAITCSEKSVVADATGKLECNDINADPVHETMNIDEKTVTEETGVVEMTTNYSFESCGFKESVENDTSSEMCVNINSPESMSGAEDVSTGTNSSVVDAQIKAFENIARQKGIKVGRDSSGTSGITDPCDGKVIENIEAEDFKDVEDVIEQDAQIARFQEMARLNGIKVGGNSARKLSNDSCPEYPCVESILTQNSNRSGCYMYTTMDSEMTHVETDPQIAKFQELAWLNGIKVATSVASSSHSSLSTAYNDDSLNGPSVEESHAVQIQQYQDWKSNVFEELAKRNGIKVGKKAVPKETLTVTKASGNESIQPIFGGVFSQASTQTEVAIVVDCHSQTCEEDCGISRRTAEVQVSATKEAFEEEYLLWKLDDNAAENETELCYKDLYFDERKAREELSASLQNEKDVSANVRHNHKRAMEELKEELATKIEECEKLKKDLKALKKQKESEIKRISKESKSKEEELHTTRSTLQVKEAALEALRVVASEQTAKIKELEEQLEETKSALSDAHSREHCKTCLERNTERKEELKETGDGWTVYTGKKSKSPIYKPAKHNRLEPGRIDQLCNIDVDAPPCVHWQSAGRKKSSDCEMQSCGLSDVSCGSGSQGSQGNDSVKSRADSVVTVGDVEKETQEGPTTQDKLTEHNVDGKAPAQSYQQNASIVANANDSAQKPPSHLFNSSTFQPCQPCLFPTIPQEVLTKYLSSQMQMLQQIRPPGNGILPKTSGPVRPPPGLNTEPVPEGEVPDDSSPPSPTSTGKFSSFDKLMVALQKRFPSKNRQELIVRLRKAKAGCGTAGFRGMQIPDVVKCVESMVELEQRQASEDEQTSPSTL